MFRKHWFEILLIVTTFGCVIAFLGLSQTPYPPPHSIGPTPIPTALPANDYWKVIRNCDVDVVAVIPQTQNRNQPREEYLVHLTDNSIFPKGYFKYIPHNIVGETWNTALDSITTKDISYVRVYNSMGEIASSYLGDLRLFDSGTYCKLPTHPAKHNFIDPPSQTTHFDTFNTSSKDKKYTIDVSFGRILDENDLKHVLIEAWYGKHAKMYGNLWSDYLTIDGGFLLVGDNQQIYLSWSTSSTIQLGEKELPLMVEIIVTVNHAQSQRYVLWRDSVNKLHSIALNHPWEWK